MTTVMVTGAGGHCTPSLIEHLQKSYRVVAVDSNQFAAGLHIADAGYIVPMGSDPDWASSVRDICERESVDVLVPLVDEELEGAHEIDVPVLVPKREFIADCLDKWRLYGRLKRYMPLTHRASDVVCADGDWIVKPRRGRGGKHVAHVHTWGEMQKRIDGMDEALVQQYVGGTEYTVSVVCWRDGAIHAIVPKISWHKRGSTQFGTTQRHDGIDRICRSIQSQMCADGPFNAQFIVDEHNIPWLIEINPRFAGSSTLTIASGCDEIGGLVELALGRPYVFGEWRENVRMIRRTVDMFDG